MKKESKLLLLDVVYHSLITVLMICTVLFIDWKIRPMFKDISIVVFFIEFIFLYWALKFFINAFTTWKHYATLKRVVTFPECFYPLVVKPYTKMLYGFVTLLMLFGFISLGLRVIPEYLGYNWKYSTKTFVGITISAIMLRAFGNTIIANASKWNYKYDNRKEHTQLTLTLINEQRIRYVIYFIFFFSLMYYSFVELQMPHILHHPNEAKAVLGAFGTFIAFDRLIDKTSLINFNPKHHFDLLLKVYEKDPKYKNQENYLADYLKSKVSTSNSEEVSKE